MALSHDDLRYFSEVAQVGNISRAAERLGIRQPSLSAAVQRLERRFGCDLLIRSTSGVTLTREGKLLAQRAKAFLAEWEALESDVLQHNEQPSGTFVFGCHPSVALRWLPSVVPALLKRWPKLELQVVHDLSRKVNEQIVSHQIDFGLVVNPIPHPDLVIREMARDVFTFWGKEARWSDTLLFDPDLMQAQTLVARVEKKGVRFRRKVTSSNLELLAALAAEGAGTAVVPQHLAQLARPTLRQPRGEVPTVHDSLCLVYRADAQRSPSARAVIDVLKHTVTSLASE